MKRVYANLAVSSFFVITLILFGPTEIFIANRNDFLFTFIDYIGVLVIASFVSLIALTFLLSIIPQKVAYVLRTFIFSGTLCCYIQAMFLNGYLSALLGRQVYFDKDIMIINAFIWVVIILVIFGLRYSKLFKKEFVEKIYTFIACFISSIQLVSLIILIIVTPDLLERKESYVTSEGMLELNQENNTIVFILDSFDGGVLDDTLKMDENVLNDLDGFTYYDNMSSVFSRTYPSVPYLLTGDYCWFDIPFRDWVNDAYEKSDFISSLADNNIDIGLYTYSNYIGDSIKKDLRNIHRGSLKTSKYQLLKKGLKLLLYRDAPYALKNLFYYRLQDVNLDVVDSSEDRFRDSQDSWFMEELKEKRIEVANNGSGSFRFYHLASYHIDFDISNALSSLYIVKEYCDQMKTLGIYDNSTIIITTDHPVGYNGKYNALFMIKEPNSHGSLINNETPISQTEFIGTIQRSFGITQSSPSVFDISIDSNRKRYRYETQLYENSDIYGETVLIEYEIDGSADNKDNYHKTGKEWKILFSENHVSNK